MNINKLIIDALKPLCAPVSFQTYKGKEAAYVTFFEYLQQGESYSDDKEQLTGHYIQVDVWSKGNYRKVVDQVKKILREKGFIRKTEHDLYEPDAETFHKVLRFFYYVENKEDK